MLLGWLYLPPLCMVNHNSLNGSVVGWKDDMCGELKVFNRDISLITGISNTHRNALLSRFAALPTTRLPAEGACHFL